MTDDTKISDWISFLKEDQDYDYGFLFRLMAYKLKRMREHIAGHGIIACAEQIHDEILEVEKIFDDLFNNAYEKEEFQKVYHEFA